MSEVLKRPLFVDSKFCVGPRSDADDQSNGMIIAVADVYGPDREAYAALFTAAIDMLEALKDAIGALEFSRDYHNDLGNEEQDFAQKKLDAALKAVAKAEGRQ